MHLFCCGRPKASQSVSPSYLYTCGVLFSAGRTGALLGLFWLGTVWFSLKTPNHRRLPAGSVPNCQTQNYFFSTVKKIPQKPEGKILTRGKFMDCKMRALWVIFECHSQFSSSMEFFLIESSPRLLLHKNILMLHTSVYMVGREVTQTCVMCEQHPTSPVQERWKLM